MYILKHIPEDFIVEELSTIKPQDSGKFTYFKLWKKDLTTFEAIKRLANALHIPVNNLSFAGIKDRKAVTEQVCSARNISKKKIESVSSENMKLTFLGFGEEPVHVGGLEGNKFKIVVRNIDTLPKIKSKFKNLFGEQRFSSSNVEIGRFIVKRDFDKAVNLIKENYKLDVRGKDYVGTLRRLPRKVLILFVHAYQSFLWNKTTEISNAETLPIVGFGTESIDADTKKILDEEKVKPSDFVVRELPEVSAEGSERQASVEAKDLKVGKLEDDDVFKGKKKVLLEFSLPKGCYATEFVRQHFQ